MPITRRIGLEALSFALTLAVFVHPFIARAADKEIHPFIELEPTRIAQGAFFSGQTVRVRVMAPPGEHSVIVRCLGPAEDVHLMEKGRMMGLWMNVNEIHLREWPSLYILWASGPLEQIAAADVQKDHKLGYQALQWDWDRQFTEPSEREKFPDFLKLKERDKLYQILSTSRASVTRTREDGYQEMAIGLWIPAKAIPGLYQVEALYLEGGLPVWTEHRTFEVDKVGLPALISSVAEERALAYGIGAVILATLSGMGIGTIFGSKRPLKSRGNK